MLHASPAQAQIPAEWRAAARLVIGELGHEAPDARETWEAELRAGWNLARSWRLYNNHNMEIILAEFLTFTTLCHDPGCPENTIEGRAFRDVATEVKALRAQLGGSHALTRSIHAWLSGLDDPSGAAAKNAALWGKDLDQAAADLATANLYALFWVLARARKTPGEQAATFARFALFLQRKAWIGERCLDISRVATVIDAPPRVESCN